MSERRRPAGYDELTTPSRTTEQNSHSEDDGTITALYGGEGTLNGTYGAAAGVFPVPGPEEGCDYRTLDQCRSRRERVNDTRSAVDVTIAHVAATNWCTVTGSLLTVPHHLVERPDELSVPVVDEEPYARTWSSRVAARFRACWVTQVPTGWAATPAKKTVRRSRSIKNST